MPLYAVKATEVRTIWYEVWAPDEEAAYAAVDEGDAIEVNFETSDFEVNEYSATVLEDDPEDEAEWCDSCGEDVVGEGHDYGIDHCPPGTHEDVS